MTSTTNTTTAPTFPADAHQPLAEAVAELLRRIDLLMPEPEVNTWDVERAIDRAGDILIEHTDKIPEPVRQALDTALDEIGESVEWGIDATAAPVPCTLADAAPHAARLIVALAAAGWTLTRVSS
jgi:hypothetical protein